MPSALDACIPSTPAAETLAVTHPADTPDRASQLELNVARREATVKDRVQLSREYMAWLISIGPRVDEIHTREQVIRRSLSVWRAMFVDEPGYRPDGTQFSRDRIVSEGTDGRPSPDLVSQSFVVQIGMDLAALEGELPPGPETDALLAPLRSQYAVLSLRHQTAGRIGRWTERLIAFSYGSPYNAAEQYLRQGGQEDAPMPIVMPVESQDAAPKAA